MGKLESIQRSPGSKYRQRSRDCARKDKKKLGSFSQEETRRQYNILQISEKKESKKFFSVSTRDGVGNDGLILQQSFDHKENSNRKAS